MKTLYLIFLTTILSLFPIVSFAEHFKIFSDTGIEGNKNLRNRTLMSPDEFFGFRLTSDRIIADYKQLLEYYKYLDKVSENLLMEHVGFSTENRKMYQIIISSRNNIKNIDEIFKKQALLANPTKQLNNKELEKVINEQPIILFIGLSIHANEITASQMAPLFIYELLSEHIQKDVFNKIVIVFSTTINPDGLDKVAHWYWDTLDTSAEGTTPPFLYQKYAGHDNNRDYFMENLKETRVWSEQIFKRVYPIIVYDIHEMGPNGPRFFVPPFHDPANPAIPSTTIRDIELLGGAISSHLTDISLSGVVTNGIYDMWWHGGLRPSPNFHNQIGILTEAARVNIATPIFISFDNLIGRRGIPNTQERYINYTDVWEGGYWHSKDIALYEKETLKSLFEVALKYRKDLIRRFYERNKESIEAGENSTPYGYMFNIEENDYGRLYHLMEILNFQGVTINLLKSAVNIENYYYPPGSFVILTSQPLRQNILALLEKQEYPPRFQYPDGPPEPPYDIASWNLLQQMDIKAHRLKQPFPNFLKGEMIKLPPKLMNLKVNKDSFKNRRLEFVKRINNKGITPKGDVIGFASQKGGYILSAFNNNSYIAINRVLKKGLKVYRNVNNVVVGNNTFRPLSFIIPYKENLYDFLKELSKELSVVFYGFENFDKLTLNEVKAKRTALYESYNANSPTGWTSFVLDYFEFPYTKIHNETIKEINLKEHYDIIIFGSETYNNIVNGYEEKYPEEYRGGIGQKGLDNLLKFVKDGGSLFLIDKSSDVAIKGFEIPVINILENLSEAEFYCPGSILNLNIEHFDDPMFSGYLDNTFAYFKNSPTFEVMNNEAKVLASWPNKADEVLASGWIEGETIIEGKPAIIDMPLGKGHIYLTAFDIVHRGQPHSTFKILFNSLLK